MAEADYGAELLQEVKGITTKTLELSK